VYCTTGTYAEVAFRENEPSVLGPIQLKLMLADNSRRAEVLEGLAELYLRLNGYFCIRNYLQHRSEPDDFGLHTESDLLALRMAEQEEVLENGQRQPNDPSLVLPQRQAAIDCIVAEVKEPSVEFNKPIRGPEGPRRIANTLRMFGVFPNECFGPGGAGERISQELHKKVIQDIWTEHPTVDSPQQRISVRMVVFAPETAKHSNDRKHFDLQKVLDFTRKRMRPGESSAPYRRPDVPSASPWRGCTRLIVEVLDKSYASNKASLRLGQFIGGVLALWDTQILVLSKKLQSTVTRKN
jgi:hypothetical protein